MIVVGGGRSRSPGPAAAGRRGPGDLGQSTVELALALPVVVLLLLAVIQVGQVVRDQVLVTHAAREAVRAAAVGEGVDAAERAATSSSGLDPGRLSVVLVGGEAAGSAITATVRYRSTTDIPVLGPVVPDIDLTAEATMRRE